MPLTRRLILQKARHHPTLKTKALTDCKRTVSGTISLPSRGTFHHSLTVLIRYRSPRSIQAYRVVPADSQQISRARCYLGTTIAPPQGFQVRDSHPLRPTLPSRSPNPRTSTPGPAEPGHVAPQHHTRNPCRVSHACGLASSAFARRYSRNHGCFLFLRVLRCFTSPRSLHTPYVFRCG